MASFWSPGREPSWLALIYGGSAQTFPMMDENAWLVEVFHRAFPFLVYAFFCVVSLLFVWRYVPETKGKTQEEIERSWKR